MGTAESKNYQLRVRVSSEECDLLKKLVAERKSGETVSDLVREGIALLIKNSGAGPEANLTPSVQAKVERLAVLLKREPKQVEDACVEGILDLIERKCEVPLIVMETHLHLKYRGKDSDGEFPWNLEADPAKPPEADSNPKT